MGAEVKEMGAEVTWSEDPETEVNTAELLSRWSLAPFRHRKHSRNKSSPSNKSQQHTGRVPDCAAVSNHGNTELCCSLDWVGLEEQPQPTESRGSILFRRIFLFLLIFLLFCFSSLHIHPCVCVCAYLCICLSSLHAPSIDLVLHPCISLPCNYVSIYPSSVIYIHMYSCVQKDMYYI